MKAIRMAEPSDARAVLEIYGPVVATTAISFEAEVPAQREMEERIAGTLGFAPWLVCDDGGRVAGYAYASRHRERAAYRWCVDVSVYVRDDRRRAGVGRALYTSLFSLLRLQGFRAAHAGITLPNEASVRLHQSLGFEAVGVYPRVGFKLGRWHDVGWWQLPLLERSGEPGPTVPPEALRRSGAWAEALDAGLPLLSR
ncbi:MAG TPA: arsinothricin resistance N-acetyltransferase ArsN1 family B [Anaeromyxobacter sp.]